MSERRSLIQVRLSDRAKVCRLQIEGITGALNQRVNETPKLDFFLFSDDRLLDLENQAKGLAEAIAELRILRRYE
jgi:hypothetical protein